MNNRIKSPSWKSLAAVVATIAVCFAVVVVGLALQARQEIRQQILDRDGHVLTAVARMLQSSQSDAPGDDLEVALKTSRLRGVLAVRLFDAEGNFTFPVPFEVSEAELSSADRERLQAGEPVARFHPEADLGELFALLPSLPIEETTPLQEVIIPLYKSDGTTPLGFVQYMIEGTPVENEFSALDRTLLLQSGTALALGLTALMALAALAYYRLTRSHRALEAQTERLTSANRELSLAARTSAVGAVTSHLIHGIRNPLAGLDLFFQTRNMDELPGQSPESWRQLADATNRIRNLVDDVVEVLREEDVTSSFALTLEDLQAVLQEKLQPKADAAEVRLEFERRGQAVLPGHAANLILLVLINLLDNALSLTPRGKCVWIRIKETEKELVFEVADEGPGIPEELQRDIFIAGKSGRAGGTGLGLAISHRLARNINADLTLVRSDSTGSVFSLRYPWGETSDVSPAEPVEAER